MDTYTLESRNITALSTKESECLFYLLRGKPLKSIADNIGLSKRTVETYVDNIKAKFTCYTKHELLDIAFQHGLIHVVPKSIINSALTHNILRRA